MTLLNMMIRTGRLSEFISEVVVMHNEEVEEQTLWECWLHKNFEQSFADYRETIRLNSAQETGKEDLADIIKQSQKILSFEPPDIFTKEGEDH
ncbi:MAG: hypothetical protein EGQ46_03205 [Clostridiales bacterium]|jgi:hypothetical protein|nr:hypothetical protein [Clostridiales bacterium]